VRAFSAFALLLCLAALAAGCGGLGGDDSESEATEATPAQTTSSTVRTAIYERAYSECATYPMSRLAKRYQVEPKIDLVTLAVARFWTRQFKGGQDALAVGERACIEGFNDPVGNPA
jgi:hypothetical protein